MQLCELPELTAYRVERVSPVPRDGRRSETLLICLDTGEYFTGYYYQPYRQRPGTWHLTSYRQGYRDLNPEIIAWWIPASLVASHIGIA